LWIRSRDGLAFVEVRPAVTRGAVIESDLVDPLPAAECPT
jgi:hypothetical protein